MEKFSKVFLWDYRSEAIWEVYPVRQVLFHTDKKEFIVRINKIPEILREKVK